MGAPTTPSFFSLDPDAPTFPAALRQLSRPPAALWTAGRLPRNDERLVAIVGARAASLTGCGLAERLAVAAVRAGYRVVSGGALGNDAAGAAAPIDLALRVGATLPEALAGLAEAELSGWARRLPERFEVLRAN
jgi:DNA processing protein